MFLQGKVNDMGISLGNGFGKEMYKRIMISGGSQ